jgi:PKD repeat protein
MARQLTSTCFVLALVLAGTIMTGCRSVPVDILSISAPDNLQTNETGTFSVTTNEDAKQPVTVTWDFGDNATGAGSSSTHAFRQAGTYTVTATATNRKGKSSDTATESVVVADPPVPASITGIRASTQNPDTRTEVRFTATVNGDSPITYAWNFGDGGTGSSATPTHTFSQPGTYTVTLNASNQHGSDSRSMSLTVQWYEAAICREITELDAAFFDANGSVLNDAARASLDQNLQILNDCPNTNVRVEGIAAPGERVPQELSEDRARAVEQYYTDHGVAASRIVTVGMGRASGLTSKKEGLSQYRRVDTIIIR